MSKNEEVGFASALRARADHRCPSRISHRGSVIRCFYYRGHTEDRAVVVPLHEAAGMAWRDDDDRELTVERPYACPGCGTRYRTSVHAAGCAEDHEAGDAAGTAGGGQPNASDLQAADHPEGENRGV